MKDIIAAGLAELGLAHQVPAHADKPVAGRILIRIFSI